MIHVTNHPPVDLAEFNWGLLVNLQAYNELELSDAELLLGGNGRLVQAMFNAYAGKELTRNEYLKYLRNCAKKLMV